MHGFLSKKSSVLLVAKIKEEAHTWCLAGAKCLAVAQIMMGERDSWDFVTILGHDGLRLYSLSLLYHIFRQCQSTGVFKRKLATALIPFMSIWIYKELVLM
jgi:hypothetical protein